MPARPVTVDQIPDSIPTVVLVVGDEEFLVARALGSVAAAVRRADPSVVETERAGAEIDGPELHELLGPSLFGDARLLLIRSAHEMRAAAVTALRPYLETPADGSTIVVHHAGGARNKALIDAMRSAGALEIACAKLTRPEERQAFVRAEVQRHGGTITPDAVPALLDAVGTDLRELAAVCGQLVSDSSGRVDIDLVRAYHRGRADVTGFAVADHAVSGRSAQALETLRHAMAIGVPDVLVADALADGIRSIARVASAGRADPYALAQRLGMPPWKVKKAATQARGWTEAGVRQALSIVADLNAEVKGAAASGGYALERAVLRLAAARNRR